MNKWLSLRHWSHVIRRVVRLLASPRIPVREKLLFLIPVVVYWVMPDALPFLPIDDIAVTMLLMGWFSGRMESKYDMSDR
ncbi:hypothetical protein [Paenibacillus sp. HJGM_3]|uniref:hypothetical protein n=1 Tax=Paenibacillus sp. HJGM_3 TaxID=3379816 RepID=UPI00385E525B